MQDQYKRSLNSFSELLFENAIFEKIREHFNYTNAIKNLQEMSLCTSIGEIHDLVALLMNNISKCLFDEKDPDRVVDDDDIITAFLLVIGKSGSSDLPLYLDILNKFLDNNTLNIKGVGQGIHKLTFIVNNHREWSSFIGANNR